MGRTTAWAGRRLEANDILDFGGEIGIILAFEGADAVRLEVVGIPDTLDGAQGQTGRFGIARPVQCVASPGGSAPVMATISAGAFGGHRHFAGFTGLVAQQVIDAFLGIALLPTPNCGPGRIDLRRDLLNVEAFGADENDARTQRVFFLGVWTASNFGKTLKAFGGGYRAYGLGDAVL